MGIQYKAGGLVGLVPGEEGDGIVTAFVSVTGIKDNVNDIILPGAYTKTLAKRSPKGVWHHAWVQPVAKTLDVKELMPGDPELPATLPDGSPWPPEAGALRVKMLFNLTTERGMTAYKDVLFYGDEQEWSIGYNVPFGKAVKDPKTGIRSIKELDLFEYSPVLFGAMPHARTGSVKDAQEAFMEFKSLHGDDAERLLMEYKDIFGTDWVPEEKGLNHDGEECSNPNHKKGTRYDGDPSEEKKGVDWDDDEDEDVDDQTPKVTERKGEVVISAAQADELENLVKSIQAILSVQPATEVVPEAKSGLPGLLQAAGITDDEVLKKAEAFETHVEAKDAREMESVGTEVFDIIEKRFQAEPDNEGLVDATTYLIDRFAEVNGAKAAEQAPAEQTTEGKSAGQVDDTPEPQQPSGQSVEVKSIPISAFAELGIDVNSL